MKRSITTILFGVLALSLSAQERPLWMRYPAISPDGQSIAFSYKGDIFTVPVAGGTARQLTTNAAYDSRPVWSPDGQTIAFVSDREGGLNVYVVGRDGGEPRQLTTNSNQKIPLAFSDESHVLFSTSLMPTAQSNIFAAAKFPQVYEVSTSGGRPRLFSALPMADISVNRTTGDVLYQDIKGSEDVFRKHHQSPICRDIWLWARGSASQPAFTRLTDFGGEDRNPVWTADGKAYYYLSEKDGTSNVYWRSLDGRQERQLTRHTVNPVRYLSASADGTLCYGYDGEIYTVREGREPQRVSIRIVSDRPDKDLIRQVKTSGATEICVSPSGKEVAFILHGDVYVTSVDYKTTRQITDTPEQERNLSIAPDGRSIVYSSERNGSWGIYQTTISAKDEKQFTYATALTEEKLSADGVTTMQPQYSPDGKEVAWLEDRGTLRILNLATRKVRTVMDGRLNFSYSDGDLWFEWSPDGRWLLSSYIGDGGYHHHDIALVDASGQQKPFNLTNSAYSDDNGKWALGGRAMLFESNRDGFKNHGGHGAHVDYYLMFFDIDAYERFLMTKEEKSIYDEAEKEARKAQAESGKKDKAKHSSHLSPLTSHLSFDLQNCRKRIVRLTTGSANMGDALLTAKGDTLYYLATFEGGYDLWKRDLLENKTEIVLKDVGSRRLSTDKKQKTLFLLGRGGIKKIDLAKGKPSGVDFETVFNYRPYEERRGLFEHVWRQVDDKFYRPDIHGVDWKGYHDIYEKFLPYINNEYDFRDMLGEMLGELNASHTGARYGGKAATLRTASLGAFYDQTYDGDGLRIEEVVYGGPLQIRNTGIQAGDIIEQIDGTPILRGEDYFPLLDGKAGKPTRLTVLSPKSGQRRTVSVKPISGSQEDNLLYDRWVARNRHLVDSLSGGRVAYVHIRSMNGDCFRKLYDELLNEDNRLRDAVIVDERHNGGGYLHDDLCHLLSGRQHSHFLAHGKYLGVEPSAQWIKPSCVLICEDDYSNACGFPREYQDLAIGKLIGTPVAGTASSVWWETMVNGVTFGIPQVGRIDIRGDYGENTLLQPEIVVYNQPEDYLSGRDRQLERAVEEMLREGAAFKEKTKDQFGGHLHP